MSNKIDNIWISTGERIVEFGRIFMIEGKPTKKDIRKILEIRGYKLADGRLIIQKLKEEKKTYNFSIT